MKKLNVYERVGREEERVREIWKVKVAMATK